MFGFLGGSSVFLPMFNLDTFIPYSDIFIPAGNFGITLYVFILTYAIFRHQLMDITVIIKKTFSYSVVLLMLIVPSFIVVILSEKYLPNEVHYPILAVLFMVVGFVFPRIKVQAERNLETILFKGVFDYKETLDNLSKKMATLHNLDELLLMSTQTIAQAIDTKNLGVYLREDGVRFALKSFYGEEKKTRAEVPSDSKLIHFLRKTEEVIVRGGKKARGHNHRYALLDEELDDLGATLCIPIKFEKELRGFMIAAEKESAGDYSREELRVLSTMANQLAVAIENSLKYEEITKLNINLEGYVNEIKELNVGLEKKVDERTDELKKANEELKQLDKLKSEFFSNVSHELRTPLTNIILPIQNILQDLGDQLHPDNVSEKKAILRNANRLMKRINELLDFSRLEAGRTNFRARQRNLNGILDDIIAASKIGADQMGIALHFTPGPDLSEVWVDEEKIEKVFVNLIGNAMKFTGQGGEILVTTTKGQVTFEGQAVPGVICSVKDTGVGISAGELPHIFERFRQADGSTSRKYEGTGLGLFLVKEFLDLHHGDIEVVSTVGKGSEFIVKLRLGRDHFLPEEVLFDTVQTEGFHGKRRQAEDRRRDKRRSGYDRRLGNRDDQDTISFMQVQLSDLDYNRNKNSESAAQKAVQDENKKSILIVEDNQDLAENIARCLTGHYNVYVTYNGAQAMARLKQELPDLIVSDVMMPEMDGHELCRRVKDDERTLHIPIILLTAKAGLADKIIGLKYGADQYLAKPFNPRELLAVVESLVTQRELHAQLGRTLQELKEAQVQLVHTARMEAVGQLAAGLAHEVKNKMYCVRAGFEGINQRLTMLHEGKIKIEDIYDRLIKAMATNNKALESSLNMVNTLLSFSRKNKETKGHMIAADVNKGIRDTLAIVIPMVQEKVSVKTELTAIPLVVCSIEEINQVVMNLIINAYQAMIEPGLVRISTNHEDDKVVITVNDNGPGIPADTIDKIFSPFFSTKPEGENTGLGLSICYSIINAHHGTIEVKSEPGQGTEFRINLPVTQPESDKNHS
jgi:signal transduction histidine kinase